MLYQDEDLRSEAAGLWPVWPAMVLTRYWHPIDGAGPAGICHVRCADAVGPTQRIVYCQASPTYMLVLCHVMFVCGSVGDMAPAIWVGVLLLSLAASQFEYLHKQRGLKAPLPEAPDLC